MHVIVWRKSNANHLVTAAFGSGRRCLLQMNLDWLNLDTSQLLGPGNIRRVYTSTSWLNVTAWSKVVVTGAPGVSVGAERDTGIVSRKPVTVLRAVLLSVRSFTYWGRCWGDRVRCPPAFLSCQVLWPASYEFPVSRCSVPICDRVLLPGFDKMAYCTLELLDSLLA